MATPESSASTDPQPAADGFRGTLLALRVLLALCVAVPVAVYLAIAVHRLNMAQQEAVQRLDRTLRIAHEHALKVLETNEIMLGRVLDLVGAEDDTAVRRREGDLHHQLVAMSAGKPQIQSIWAWGPDGRPLVGNRYLPAPRHLDVSDRAFFRWHAERRGGLFLTEPLVGRVTRDRFFDLSLGRYRRDGTFAGLVSVGLFPRYFESLHRDLVENEPGMVLTMFRSDGAVYSHVPGDAVSVETRVDDDAVLRHVRLGEARGGLMTASKFEEGGRVVLVRQVGPYPLYVSAAMERSAIRAAWLREMGTYAAFGGPLALGVLLAAWIAARRTRQALEAAERLQQESVARQQMEAALLQSQKLEAIGRLTGGVAHDFNNALMVISGNLFILKKLLGTQHQRFIGAMDSAVVGATALTRQLLAFSRRQALHPEVVRLQDKMPAMDPLLKPILGAGIVLHIDVDPATAPVMVDAAELELGLLNLAVNARDAMPDGGEFRLRAFNGDPGPDGRAFVVIEAADNGKGIAADDLPRVFEPFFTTKPIGQGTGLGLSQVQGLCQRAGGHASIASEAGRGTRVQLGFPAEPVTSLPPAPAPTGAPPALSARVLVVEDNAGIAGVIEESVRSMGCEVVLRTDAAQARAWLESHPTPDLLLSDIVMPGDMDGVQLARYALERFPGMKIVLMTGYSDQMEALADLKLPVLPKPFSPDALNELIAALLGPRSASRPPTSG